MDGEGSRVPILWDDRGKVAKAFDVGIFSNFRNLESFQFRQGGHPVLDVLSEGDRRSSTNVSSLPPVPRTRSAAGVPVGTYVLLQRLSPKVKPFLPLPRETALASSFTLAFLST